MHEYSTDFVKGTSCLVSNIGDAELKIHAYEQEVLEVTIKENMIKDQCIHKVPFIQGLELQKSVSTNSTNKVKVETKGRSCNETRL